MSRRFLWI